MVQLVWKTVWRFLKILKIELPYDPAIPHLDIYPKQLKSGSQRAIYTPIFTAANRWKQPKCPLMDEGIKKMCNKILINPKKEGNPVIWDNMDGPCGHYAK